VWTGKDTVHRPEWTQSQAACHSVPVR